MWETTVATFFNIINDIVDHDRSNVEWRGKRKRMALLPGGQGWHHLSRRGGGKGKDRLRCYLHFKASKEEESIAAWPTAGLSAALKGGEE